MSTKLEFDSLEEGLERVSKKHKATLPKTLKSIDAMIAELNSCKQKLTSDTEMETDEYVRDNLVALHKSLSPNKIANDYKELHAPISKLGKSVDKSFRADIEKATPTPFKYEPSILHEVIAQHLYRQGRFDLGDLFAKETQIEETKAKQMKEPFVEMYQILLSLREHDLAPAINWARARRTELTQIGSSLEFRFHRLQFIDLIVNQKQDEALAYARAHFAQFAPVQMSEIQHLMGSFVYAKRLNKSPYASLFHPNNMPTLWDDIARQFSQNSCTLMGLPQDSPLHVSITAGFKALPTLIKLAALHLVKVAGDETATAEVTLGPEFQFHSIFACPVSREQSSVDSPPMLLPCGHVISKSSMMKLCRGSSSKFKCPYCPSEQVLSQTKQLYF
jgi:hypothetical protein